MIYCLMIVILIKSLILPFGLRKVTSELSLIDTMKNEMNAPIRSYVSNFNRPRFDSHEDYADYTAFD